MSRRPSVAAVVIGRNEGARLVGCLASLKGQVDRVIYVDSASSDNSVAEARGAGAKVVQLDPSRPFSAARARSEGFEALGPETPDFIQFIDGDCSLEPGWIEAGRGALEGQSDLGIVTGWRSEIDRDRSVYNALCDFEWHRPAGDILTCGGDMMVRSTAFQKAGGFDATVIAAEDDEFCIRVRKSGWKIRRLPLEMTVHDAAMTRFSEWWQRAVRSGHGFAQVGSLHPEYFIPERRRVVFYGAFLPLFALVGLFLSWWLIFAVFLIYGLSYVRTASGLRREGLVAKDSWTHAVFLTLSKVPNFLGMLVFWRRRIAGRNMSIIEYK